MKDRSEKFDIARGIGILLITLGHCKVPVELNHYIYAFHVPLFFVIAGGYLTNKNIATKAAACSPLHLVRQEAI